MIGGGGRIQIVNQDARVLAGVAILAVLSEGRLNTGDESLAVWRDAQAFHAAVVVTARVGRHRDKAASQVIDRARIIRADPGDVGVWYWQRSEQCTGVIEPVDERAVFVADVPGSASATWREGDAFRVKAPLAAAQTARERLGMGQHIGVVRLKAGEGATIDCQHVGVGVDDDDLILSHRSRAEVWRDGDGQPLHARMIILQAVTETAVRQPEHRGVNGAVAVDDGRRVQPHAGKNAAERICTGAELVEGISRQTADADQAEIDERLGLSPATECCRQQGGHDDLFGFHRVGLVGAPTRGS